MNDLRFDDEEGSDDSRFEKTAVVQSIPGIFFRPAMTIYFAQYPRLPCDSAARQPGGMILMLALINDAFFLCNGSDGR